MIDPTLFAAGALFTQDYLGEGITNSAQFKAVDVVAIRAALANILSGFPHATKPNEATTESDLVWPVLALLGWGDYLTQQNLSATGRVDVPDGLLFVDASAKAKANSMACSIQPIPNSRAMISAISIRRSQLSNGRKPQPTAAIAAAICAWPKLTR